MPIYDKSVREIVPDMVAELIPSSGDTFSRDDALEWFAQRYPKIKQGTIFAHLIRFSTNSASRLHYQVKETGEDLLFKLDESRFRRYDAATDPVPIHSKADIKASDQVVDEEDSEDQLPSEFAYERDLKNFLAKNLFLIESGLSLYEDEEEGIDGIEFSVGKRFIDILAVNANNDFVVIELKVSRGYDRVVGQLLRYMGWIKKHHAEENQRVLGVIVAREISEDLRFACSMLPDVRLLEYNLSVKLTQVES